MNPQQILYLTHTCTYDFLFSNLTAAVWTMRLSSQYICRIDPSRHAALPPRQERLHFYLRGRTRRGNAPYCGPSVRKIRIPFSGGRQALKQWPVGNAIEFTMSYIMYVCGIWRRESGGSVYQSEVGGKEFSARVNVSCAHQNNTPHPPTSWPGQRGILLAVTCMIYRRDTVGYNMHDIILFLYDLPTSIAIGMQSKVTCGLRCKFFRYVHIYPTTTWPVINIMTAKYRRLISIWSPH